MWQELLTSSFLCGAAALDRRVLFQCLLSSPLVVGAIVGAGLGHLELGLEIGAVASLLWIHELPVGASIPPDDTLLTGVAVFMAWYMQPFFGPEIAGAAALGLLWGVPWGLAAQRGDSGLRRLNAALVHGVTGTTTEDLSGRLARAHVWGALAVFWVATAQAMLAMLTGMAAFTLLLPVFTGDVLQGLRWFWAVLPMLGIGAAVVALNRTRAWSVIASIVILVGGSHRWLL